MVDSKAEYTMKARGWKKAETRFARDVGSERKPCDGSRDGADFEDALCCYQLKVRALFPAWLGRWLGGIQGTARDSQRIGVLVIKHPHDADERAIVMLSWKDWVDLHGDARRRAHEQKAIDEKNHDALEALKAVQEAFGAALRPQSKPPGI